ncbi:hypothetical protein [Aeromicrobium fastidiosum]|uniref:Uncharacterized protein n=1 Tax=Aeromicrobium fastidiosum TaxID=52699 RepID=A0A641ARC7_9ACTN|nr:hypothetical protein [Aeromicrobium fastidiosum]KAA1380664.1 hypothetical protein ESP62_005695 [Aeromicrobium fastidiosum]MBP2390272.1 hypothetical protein [Aeromicrobium fastidiosum]
MSDSPDDDHVRPDGVSDRTVEALGKLSEALETVEEARGHLYAFHRRCGTADLALGEAVDLLREAGHAELADAVETDLVGRNILEGRWSFQVVEEYDDGYYAAFKEHERAARTALVDGRSHLFEAEMKEDRRTHGRRHHEATPATSGSSQPRE